MGWLIAVLLAVQDPQQAQPDQQVPFGHWAYGLFHELATEGVVTRHPAFDFAGGRIFTRGEMAQLAGDAVRAVTENRALAAAARLEKIKRLIAEFEPEMKLAGHPRELPEPAGPEPPKPVQPRPVRAYGTDVHTYTVTEGDGNDVYSRIVDFNVEGDFFHAKLAGTLDTRDNEGIERHTGDLFVGSRYSWQATERFVEFHGRVFREDLRGRAKIGDLRNTTFASGVMIGASDIDGLRGSLRFLDRFEAIALNGHLDGGTDVRAARVTGTFLEGALLAGLNAADIEAQLDTDSGTLWGASAFYTDRFVDVFFEFADDVDHGSGLFARVIFYYHHNLQFQADLRNYRDFGIEENSAPIYAGISGGQDEDDQGGLFKTVWSPERWITLTGRLDRAERHDGTQGRTDVFGEARVRPWTGGEGAVSFEAESASDPDADNSLLTLGFTQAIGTQGAASGTYTRDDRDGDVIHTLRDTVRYTLLEGKLTLELSHTFRDDDVGDEHILQPRVLYTVGPNIFASVRATVSSDDDRTDPSVEFTLVIRW